MSLDALIGHRGHRAHHLPQPQEHHRRPRHHQVPGGQPVADAPALLHHGPDRRPDPRRHAAQDRLQQLLRVDDDPRGGHDRLQRHIARHLQEARPAGRRHRAHQGQRKLRRRREDAGEQHLRRQQRAAEVRRLKEGLSRIGEIVRAQETPRAPEQEGRQRRRRR